MNSSSALRSPARLAAAVLAATVVTAGGLLPLLDGQAAAATPAAPTVVGPVATGPGQKEVVLDWTPVAGTSSYVVEVDTDGEWSDDPTLSLTTVASRITLPTSLPHASYVWRVAAVTEGLQSRWSTNGTFTRGWTERARALSPVGSPSPAPSLVTFSWSPVPTASEYQLQVSTSRFFDAAFRTQAGVKTESCFTTRTSITPFNSQADARNDGAGDCVFSLLRTGEPRYWRVRPLDHVVDDAPEVNTTPVVDEGISSLPPAKAGELDTSACPETVKAPTATPSATPSASTSPTPTATSTASPTTSPAPSPTGTTTGSPSAAPTPSAAPDEAGGCEPAHTVEKGAWSAGVLFTDRAAVQAGPVPAYTDLVTDERPMPTPTLSRDVCVGDLCRDFPTVSWDGVPGAQAYRLYVALDADFTNIHAIVETPGNSWTPTTQWRDSTAGAHYYVVVQPCTTTAPTVTTTPTPSPTGAADGGRAGCDEPSAPAKFRKSSPRLAQTAPASGAPVGGAEVVLSWQGFSAALSAATGAPATSEAYAYRVQVARTDNPDFAKAGLVEDVVVDSTHHVSTDTRYAEGAHLWRVQPVDASGHRLPWSATRTFTRDSIAPTFRLVPTLLPARGSFQVRFSEPVVGVGPTSVVLSTVPSRVTASADRRRAVVAPGRPLLPGASHTVTVGQQVRDAAGNSVSPSRVGAVVDPTVDDRSAALVLSGGWQRFAASNAVERTFSRSLPTVARPTSATVALTGRAVEVKGCVGPTYGTAEIWVDGVRAARVDGYRSYSGCGVVLTRTGFTVPGGVHRVELRSTGLKNARSTGTTVSVDAVIAVR